MDPEYDKPDGPVKNENTSELFIIKEDYILVFCLSSKKTRIFSTEKSRKKT